MQLSNTRKQQLKNKYGEWAIVTGASSGIGYELAKQLALAGFNLVINSRQHDKLTEVKTQLLALSAIQIKVVASDASDASGVNKLIDATLGLNVGLLIVSAGFGTSGKFVNNTLHNEINMLKVNCEALLTLTHHYSKQFVNQKRGGIILLSSIAAFQGTPYTSNYSATKAYVQTLAEGLAEELRPEGVDVLAVAPGPVATQFGKRANMKMNISLTPEQVAIPALNALGRTTTVFPGLLTKLIRFGLIALPRSVKVKIMGMAMRRMTEQP